MQRHDRRHSASEQSTWRFFLTKRNRYALAATASILTHCILAALLMFADPLQFSAQKIQTIHFVDLSDMPEPEIELPQKVASAPTRTRGASAQEEMREPQAQRQLSAETIAAGRPEEAGVPAQPFRHSPIVIERTGRERVLNLASPSAFQAGAVDRGFRVPDKLLRQTGSQVLAVSHRPPVGAGLVKNRMTELKRGSPRKVTQLKIDATGVASQDRFANSLALGVANAVISGPLGTRKVIEQIVPQFPGWARTRKISARISLQFSVMRDGRVKENVVVAQTSGSSEWDHLVVAALRRWRFEPFGNKADKSQSGLITFQFVAE